MRKINIYLAGSMFCEADRMYNAYLAKRIRDAYGDKINLYVPQENMSINDKTKCADSHAIFWGDFNRLKETDVFIARVDGDVIPSGTSCEVGLMAYRIMEARERRERAIKHWEITGEERHGITEEEVKREHPVPIVLGLCTDSRNPKATYLEAKNELMKNHDYESQYCYFNLFTLGTIKVCGRLTTSADDLVEAIGGYLNEQ